MIAAVAYGSAGFLSSLTVEQPLVMVTPLRYDKAKCSRNGVNTPSDVTTMDCASSPREEREEEPENGVPTRVSVASKSPPTSPPMTRRIIFPSLHRSVSEGSSQQWEGNKISQIDNDDEHIEQLRSPPRRMHSLEAQRDGTPKSHLPLSPLSAKKQMRLSKEISPKSVVCSDPGALLSLPRLGSVVDDKNETSNMGIASVTRFSVSDLVIPPFKRTNTPPEQLTPEKPPSTPRASVIDTPSYKKRTTSPPFKDLIQSRGMMPPIDNEKQSLCHSRMQSILRGNEDSVESASSLRSVSPSESTSDNDRRVGFDPRVWVCEFERDKAELKTTWYSPTEMDRFKQRAIERILSSAELLPTGTGRSVKNPLSNKALFTNPALQCEEDEDDVALQRLARLEVRNILIVDPHEMCSKLFQKTFQEMFPQADMASVRSSGEAIANVEKTLKPFDLIVVEERLKFHEAHREDDYEASGSALIRRLMEDQNNNDTPRNRRALFVGVSAHFDKDREQLEEGGASLTWPKPPPKLDRDMRDQILKQLLVARGKEQAAQKYFP